MDWKKLQEIVTSLVNTQFSVQGLDLDFRHIRFISQKSFESIKRLIEFNVHDFANSTEEEKLSELSEPSDVLRTSKQLKKQMKKINESFKTYDKELEEAEKRFQEFQLNKLPPSIIEKLICLLETMKDYEPDFFLNIRDISLDSWKESLNYEKIIQTERKKYEGIIVKLECKWNKRTEFIKEKAAGKILRTEKELKTEKDEKNACRERLSLQIEDLRGWIRRKMDFDNENLNTIKQAGFKGIRDVIRGLKNMEKAKAKFNSQIEGLNKELKGTKGKLNDCNIKLEAYKRRSEGFEREFVQMENTFLGIFDKVLKNVDKKNAELYLSEKNYGRIVEVFKEVGEKKEAGGKDDGKGIKEEAKGSEGGNAAGKKVLGRNETEVKSFNKREGGIVQNKSVNQRIKKSLNNSVVAGNKSERSEQNEIYKQSNDKLNEISEKIEKPQKKTLPRPSPRHSPKPSYTKVSNQDSSQSDKKVLGPPSPQQDFSPIKKEPTTQRPERTKSPLNSSERPEPKQNPNFSSVQSSPLAPPLSNISESPSKGSKILSIHRRSLDSQPREKVSSHKSSKNKLKSSLKNIFSAEILKSTKVLDPVKSSQILSVIQGMDLEDLFSLRINLNGDTKTVKELAFDSIKGALNQPTTSLVIENAEDTKKPKKKSESIEKPHQLLKNKALKLFVLVEKYIQNAEKTRMSISDLIKYNLNTSQTDDILEYIRNSQDPDQDLLIIPGLVSRHNKYDLLFKLFQIPKSIADDWKSEKIHIFNKIRWRNLIMKQRIKDHQFLTELAFKIEVEVRDKKQRTKHSESNVTISKHDLHNNSMENIGLAENKNTHKRNISLNNKGLNYFLPHIQKTPRIDKVPNSFITSELWVRNR